MATVDPRYATAGQMLEQVLEREDWGQAVKDNIVVESRGHSDAAVALLTGHVDAAVVWNFIAALYAEQLEEVDIGVDFEQDIRVTLTRLTTSTNHEEAEMFMDFATNTDFARNVFRYYGYLPADQE